VELVRAPTRLKRTKVHTQTHTKESQAVQGRVLDCVLYTACTHGCGTLRPRREGAPSLAQHSTPAAGPPHASDGKGAHRRSRRPLANLPQPYTHTSHNTHTAQALTPAESVSSSSQPVSSPSLTPPLPAHIPFRVPRAAARGGGGREVSAEGCGNSPSQGHLQLRVLVRHWRATRSEADRYARLRPCCGDAVLPGFKCENLTGLTPRA